MYYHTPHILVSLNIWVPNILQNCLPDITFDHYSKLYLAHSSKSSLCETRDIEDLETKKAPYWSPRHGLTQRVEINILFISHPCSHDSWENSDWLLRSNCFLWPGWRVGEVSSFRHTHVTSGAWAGRSAPWGHQKDQISWLPDSTVLFYHRSLHTPLQGFKEEAERLGSVSLLFCL